MLTAQGRVHILVLISSQRQTMHKQALRLHLFHHVNVPRQLRETHTLVVIIHVVSCAPR